MRVRIIGIVMAAIVMATAMPMQAKTQLLVYTTLGSETMKKYTRHFNKSHPDIEITWVLDSIENITTRLLAEKDNPRADVIWGLAVTSLLLLKREGLLLPYAPAGLGHLDDKFRDKANPPFWTGMDAWVAAICYNVIEGLKHQLPVPTSWKDLIKPVYHGHVVMPNPRSSGTGFFDVAGWLQLFGEEDGWAFMDALHTNISHYTHSGSKPCQQAASGEVAIGISFAFRGARLKAQGAPLAIVIPSEGIGWDIEATAIVKGTKKLEAAKELVDWSITKEANQLYNEKFAVVAMPHMAKPVLYFPENIDAAMIRNDFEWAAMQRAAILTEWRQRYDTKSERQ